MSGEHIPDNEDLYVEDFELDDEPGSLGSLFSQKAGDDQDLGELTELQEAETRRPEPQFGPLVPPEESERPSLEPLGAPEDVFEKDGSEGVPEQELPKPKKGRGLLSGLKEIVSEEWEKAKAEEEGASTSTPAPAETPTPEPPEEDPSVGEEAPELEVEPAPTLEVPPGPQERAAEPPPILPGYDDQPEADDDPQESGGGFIGLLRERWALAKAAKKSEERAKVTGPEGAGLDLSPPEPGIIGGLKHRIQGTSALPEEAAASAPEDNFAQLLTPLAASEIAVLQADLAADETIFARIDRSRSAMALRQRLGFVIAMATIAFLAVVGGKHYLIDVLPDAAQPSWIPEPIQGDIAAAGLYALGLLFPLIATFIIADGVRFLMSAAAERRFDDLLLGSSAAVCSFGSLLACFEGEVVTGGIFLVAYGVIQLAARALGVRGR